MLAAAAFILTACSGLQEDGGEKSIRINLPPIVSASGNSRALSGDRLPTLKTETRRYRVTVNGMTREGTVSSYEFTLPVGIRATAIIECLNSSGEVIIRAVKDFTVSGGENIVDINLKNDGNEIIPSAPQPVPNHVTYSYGEATIGNPGGLPSDPATYNEGDVFEVQDGSVMTWTHALDGNAFKEWSASTAIEPENGGAATTAPQAGQKYKMPAGGVTLTAQWNKKSYSITYDMNASGSGGTQTSTSLNQGSVQALEDYTIDGTTPQSVSAGLKNYTFTEWSDGNGNTYAVGGKITKVTGDITLTAQWSDKDVWTVTYSKGNTQATEQSITGWESSKNAVEGESVTLPTLQAAGYTFTGWQINSATYQGGTSYTPNANVTATAQWTANTYKVKFDTGTGTGSIPDQTFTYDTPQGLTTVGNSMTKTGYTFNGWSGNGQTYTDGQSVSNLTATNNGEVTLTAQWTANTYKVKFDAGTGTGSIPDQTFTYDTPQGLTTVGNSMTKTGYAFNGWSGNGQTYTDGQSVSNLTATNNGEVTLTAQWTANQYDVSYNIDGGSGSAPTTQKVTYGQAFTPATYSGTKNGYTFSGWKVGQNGGTTFTAGQSTSDTSIINTTSAVTLYAVWEIDYKTNKADWAVGDIVCDNGNALTLANYNAVKTDSELSPAVAVVYKVENGKAWAVGKVHEKNGLAWCDVNAKGYQTNLTDLKMNSIGGSAGALTFTSNQDGKEGWSKLKNGLGSNDDTGTAGNYPAWEYCNNYGTTQNLSGDLATGWYLPTLAELFDIWKANRDNSSTIENALTAVGGNTFGSVQYWSSTLYSSAAGHCPCPLNFSTGDWFDMAPHESEIKVCAVHQFTY